VFLSKGVAFCGYTVPHPSEQRVHLRLQTTGTIASRTRTLFLSLNIAFIAAPVFPVLLVRRLPHVWTYCVARPPSRARFAQGLGDVSQYVRPFDGTGRGSDSSRVNAQYLDSFCRS